MQLNQNDVKTNQFPDMGEVAKQATYSSYKEQHFLLDGSFPFNQC